MKQGRECSEASSVSLVATVADHGSIWGCPVRTPRKDRQVGARW